MSGASASLGVHTIALGGDTSMQAAYFLFALCAFAFVLVGIISMLGGGGNTSKAMKERLDRRAIKQSDSGAQRATVSSMPATPAEERSGGRHAA